MQSRTGRGNETFLALSGLVLKATSGSARVRSSRLMPLDAMFRILIRREKPKPPSTSGRRRISSTHLFDDDCNRRHGSGNYARDNKRNPLRKNCVRKVRTTASIGRSIMARIPVFIRREHILEAVQRIDREGVPRKHGSRGYCLVVNERHFPPQYTLSRSHEVATGRFLPTSELHGGKESNEFLKRRLFRVDECTCGGHDGDRAALPDDVGRRGRSPASRSGTRKSDAHMQEKVLDVQQLVAHLADPPLNLKDRPSNPVRQRLEALRNVLRVE